MKKEDIPFLKQLVDTLEETILDLEKAFEKGDYKEYNHSRRFIIKIQKKISEIIK
ncbi:MAG: hypothetical protein AABX88_03100 [Nanoarchaeota archaeon]